ncbi:uncharacterized protein ACOB8E_009710 [Sarcophilus harrisii]
MATSLKPVDLSFLIFCADLPPGPGTNLFWRDCRFSLAGPFSSCLHSHWNNLLLSTHWDWKKSSQSWGTPLLTHQQDVQYFIFHQCERTPEPSQREQMSEITVRALFLH